MSNVATRTAEPSLIPFLEDLRGLAHHRAERDRDSLLRVGDTDIVVSPWTRDRVLEALERPDAPAWTGTIAHAVAAHTRLLVERATSGTPEGSSGEDLVEALGSTVDRLEAEGRAEDAILAKALRDTIADAFGTTAGSPTVEDPNAYEAFADEPGDGPEEFDPSAPIPGLQPTTPTHDIDVANPDTPEDSTAASRHGAKTGADFLADTTGPDSRKVAKAKAKAQAKAEKRARKLRGDRSPRRRATLLFGLLLVSLGAAFVLHHMRLVTIPYLPVYPEVVRGIEQAGDGLASAWDWIRQIEFPWS